MDKEKQIQEMADVIATHTSFDTMWDECTASASALYTAGYRKMPDNIGDLSDGYHTFNELYRLTSSGRDSILSLALALPSSSCRSVLKKVQPLQVSLFNTVQPLSFLNAQTFISCPPK